MDRISEGQVVLSTAGRDAGELFIVVQSDGSFCHLADGMRRRVEKPKKKKVKHLRLTPGRFEEIRLKLENGEIVSNAEIRKCLKLYKEIESGV